MRCQTCGAEDHSTKGHARRERKAIAALPKPAPTKPTRKRRYREDGMSRWARAYDALNGAPENDGDR